MPLDSVLELPSENPRIDNGFDFILELAFDFDRRWRRDSATRNGVGLIPFQQRDVEHRVDLRHGRRQLELERATVNSLNNLERTKLSGIELV